MYFATHQQLKQLPVGSTHQQFRWTLTLLVITHVPVVNLPILHFSVSCRSREEDYARDMVMVLLLMGVRGQGTNA